MNHTILLMLLLLIANQTTYAQAEMTSIGDLRMDANSQVNIQGDLKITTGNLIKNQEAQVSVLGSLDVTPQGSITWEVGNLGTSQAFQISNSTNINGTVKVNFINNFSPSPNDSIQLFSCNQNLGSIQDSISPNGYSGIFIYENGTLNFTNIIIIPTSGLLSIKAFLQGYYISGGLMQSVLFNSGISANPLLSDSITICLYDEMAPHPLAWSESIALNTDGTGHISIPTQYLNQTWYIVLKQRSHIETWSAEPIVLNSQTNYDFSTSSAQSYGNNELEMEPGIFALYAGELNADENIDLLDASLLEGDITSFAFGYIGSDLNGDGNVDLLDAPLLENNINLFIFSNHP